MSPTPLSDNPFAEPGDDDRTVVIPQSAVARLVAEQRERVDTGREGFGDLPPISDSPIVSAAAPLLALLGALRNIATVPDAAGLRTRTVLEVRRYEQTLRDAKLPLELIRTSHYAICASLDDVVQNTPWGSHGSWADASLVATFHQEVRSGERFFDLLTRLCQTPGKFLPTIELMYLCMSLGMQGRYRLSPRGPAALDRVREETYLVILRQRGAAEPALSLHWQGVSAPYRPLRRELPVWLTALAAFGLLVLTYILILFSLNAASDRLFAEGLGLPPSTMPTITREAPPEPVPPQPPQTEVPPQPPQTESARDKTAGFLQPEIEAGLVSVVGTPTMPIIRIQNAGMFDSGSAVLKPKFVPILARVATALQTRSGPIRIIGYTDNRPIRTVAFPSNFQLSQARAQAAAKVIGSKIDPGRIITEGRADADPIDTNATPEGRQQNRRIEITADQARQP
jgi:type VI secretion system protein ImpK